MILDALNIPNLTYEILEGSNRVGGRVYTHHFSKETHDYYDVSGLVFLRRDRVTDTFIQVGAMRFPKIPIMEK